MDNQIKAAVPPRPAGKLGATIALNQSCLCMPLDRAAITNSISGQTSIEGVADMIAERPNLFAGTPVFVAPSDLASMQSTIAAIEAAVLLPGYREAVGAGPDETRSVMMGYDFHLSTEGPRLIEVNTNAGGAFVVATLLQAIAPGGSTWGDSSLSDAERVRGFIVEMFRREWRLAGREGELATVAIVDDSPQDQYLYPEMLIAQDLLRRNGIEAVIVDAAQLNYENGVLRAGETTIDMVYNRVTDFDLSEPAHTALRRAYDDGAVVVSPAPTHHRLLADKSNLVLLSDEDHLREWGLDATHVAALQGVPKTVAVNAENADEMWAQRRNFFFKPRAGFGGRAAYRGGKLTRKVWDQILAGDYVAQAFIAPTVRGLRHEGEALSLKYDIRVFTYAGEAFLLAARMYQGQTTNFRTPGGGFAPVIVTEPEQDQAQQQDQQQ